MAGAKITIVGCGLIGGSIALALRRRRPSMPVACLDLPERLPALREAAVAEEIGSLDDMGRHVPESSVVLLATPVADIPSILARLGPLLRAGTIVTDVGSTKKQIMAEAEARMPAGAWFIGGHPMTGSERSGVEAADPLLFSERPYVLCPYPDTPPEALLTMLNLVEDLMAFPVTMDAEEHDRIMAMISHVPQLIAVALMHAAQEQDATHKMLDTLAGRGFLDMTRLAASDAGMWQGILETNRNAILEALDQFARSQARLREALVEGNAALIWERAAKRRRRMTLESMSRHRKSDLRGMIDRYDKQIIGALGSRMQVVRKIGELKKNQAAPVHDPDREKRMLLQREEWGRSLGLSADLVDRIFAMILAHSNQVQTEAQQT
jgi:prephenate dehydrogenase